MGLFKLMEDVSQTIDLEEASLLLGTAPYPPMPLFLAVGIGWGMAIVSLCLSFGDRFADRRWITPLVHTGQLALTIYILHGTVGVWAVGWAGYKPRQTLEWIIGYSVLFYVAMIIASLHYIYGHSMYFVSLGVQDDLTEAILLHLVSSIGSTTTATRSSSSTSRRAVGSTGVFRRSIVPIAARP